jgi:ubiquitin C-terminal hydrolase
MANYLETDCDNQDKKFYAAHQEQYRQKNNSFVVDTFQGTFKSTLLCPDCQRVKTTFEPFLTVQLPIPSLTTV